MNWFQFLLPFLQGWENTKPTQSAGGAAYQGMDTPSYEAPVPPTTGQKFGSGLENVANSYLNNQNTNYQNPWAKKQNSGGGLASLFKLFFV